MGATSEPGTGHPTRTLVVINCNTMGTTSEPGTGHPTRTLVEINSNTMGATSEQELVTLPEHLW